MTPPTDTDAVTDAAAEKRQDRSARIAVTVFPLIMFGAFLAAFFSPSTFVPLAGYMTPLLAVTMLGMGMTLSIPDFTMIARHPKPVILGVLSQYAVMRMQGQETDDGGNDKVGTGVPTEFRYTPVNINVVEAGQSRS